MSKKGSTQSRGSDVSGTKVTSEDVALTVLEAELQVLEEPYDEVMTGLSDAISRALTSGVEGSGMVKALQETEELLDEAWKAVETIKNKLFGDGPE